MKKWHCILILLLGIGFFSCASKKLPVSKFSSFTIPASFNGTYLNEKGKLSRLFNILDDSSNFITLEYKGGDSLKLSYETESGLRTKSYKGKLKDNFFEIYFSNKRIFIPILYTVFDVDRIRVGSSKDSDLLVYNWSEGWGMMLIFAGGNTRDEEEYSFSRVNPLEIRNLIPYKKDDKWGYIDSIRNITIQPQYDYACLFEGGVARVMLNGKWGLINNKGIPLTEMKYDKIRPLGTDNEIRVSIDGKEGYIDRSGKVIIPAVYDEIGFLGNSRDIAVSKKGDKFGYVSLKGVICPPVFDKASDFSMNVCFLYNRNTTFYGKVKYEGESFLVDKDGLMHRYKCSPDKLSILDTVKVVLKNATPDGW